MPFEGVIWRNNVVEGSHVIAGNELLQVLDCRDLFVDILVSEVDYDESTPDVTRKFACSAAPTPSKAKSSRCAAVPS